MPYESVGYDSKGDFHLGFWSGIQSSFMYVCIIIYIIASYPYLQHSFLSFRVY